MVLAVLSLVAADFGQQDAGLRYMPAGGQRVLVLRSAQLLAHVLGVHLLQVALTVLVLRRLHLYYHARLD